MGTWSGFNNGGMTSGIFPAAVEENYDYINSPNTSQNIQITGLNPSNNYTFSFFEAEMLPEDVHIILLDQPQFFFQLTTIQVIWRQYQMFHQILQE